MSGEEERRKGKTSSWDGAPQDRKRQRWSESRCCPEEQRTSTIRGGSSSRKRRRRRRRRRRRYLADQHAQKLEEPLGCDPAVVDDSRKKGDRELDHVEAANSRRNKKRESKRSGGQRSHLDLGSVEKMAERALP
eukprot:38824-Hanusia_phi.AAC.1